MNNVGIEGLELIEFADLLSPDIWDLLLYNTKNYSVQPVSKKTYVLQKNDSPGIEIHIFIEKESEDGLGVIHEEYGTIDLDIDESSNEAMSADEIRKLITDENGRIHAALYTFNEEQGLIINYNKGTSEKMDEELVRQVRQNYICLHQITAPDKMRSMIEKAVREFNHMMNRNYTFDEMTHGTWEDVLKRFKLAIKADKNEQ